MLNVNYIYVSLFRFYSARVNSQIPIECVCSPGFIVPERPRPIALYRQHKKKQNKEEEVTNPTKIPKEEVLWLCVNPVRAIYSKSFEITVCAQRGDVPHPQRKPTNQHTDCVECVILVSAGVSVDYTDHTQHQGYRQMNDHQGYLTRNEHILHFSHSAH